MEFISWASIAGILGGLAWFFGLQASADTVYWVSDIMAVTLAGGLIIMVLPDRYARFIKWIAGVASFVALLMSIRVAAGYKLDGAATYQYLESAAWVNSLGISYQLGVDGIAAAMILLTGVIIFSGVLASWDVDRRPKEFFALLLVLVTGVFGVFAAQDLFMFFLFYEIAVLPMYLLIGIWGTGPKEYSAMKLTLYLMLGSAFMLVGFLAMYFQSGAHPLTFDINTLKAASYPLAFQKLYFPFLFLGFGTLAGFWPLHTWSPDGHASAPTAVSMLHAGVLMKLGAFGIIRIAVELLPGGAKEWLPIFGLFTLVNITYGAFSALSQTDLKYVTAYSSVSHMGVVVLGICTMNDAGINGAVLQMFSHGIMTGLFFALIGFTYGKTHTRIISEYGGLGKKMPVLATFFTIGGLCSLGLPGLSGFVAEFMVFVGAWRATAVYHLGPLTVTWHWVTGIAAIGIVVTAAYVLRLLQKCFWGPITNHHYDDITDANPVQIAALTILTFVIVVVGMYPAPLVALINAGVQPVLDRLDHLPAAAAAVAGTVAKVAGAVK